MKYKLITIFCLITLHSQATMELFQKNNYFILASNYSIQFYSLNQNEDSLQLEATFYRSIDKQSFEQRSYGFNDQFPQKIKTDTLLQNTQTLGTKLDSSILQYKIQLINQYDDEMYPCGQATSTEPGVTFEYLEKVMYQKVELINNSRQTFIFHGGKFPTNQLIQDLRRSVVVWKNKNHLYILSEGRLKMITPL